MIDDFAHPIWLRSRLYPDRLHLLAPRGSLCGGSITGERPDDPDSDELVRCALCTLALHEKARPGKEPVDIRRFIENECTDYDGPPDAHLLPLRTADLDPGRAAAALDPLNGLLTNAYVEAEHAIRLLRVPQESAPAQRARANLVEAMVALDAAFNGRSRAEMMLRSPG